ncbi:hypothetical protein C6P40_002425 [Pichia californica]|uniref:Uncharacterized protein n=1 Tax=Pichia californica TaxID=460514 RepID=A0A9P6WNT8_9ASCO|nr:hypothetical protein C6P40_002425 [[Candida] californica]
MPVSPQNSFFPPQKTIKKKEKEEERIQEILISINELSLTDKEELQNIEDSFSEYWETINEYYSLSDLKELSDNVDVWFTELSKIVNSNRFCICGRIVDFLVCNSHFDQLSCLGLINKDIDFSFSDFKKVFFKAIENLSLQNNDLIERLYSLYPEGQKPGVPEGLHPCMQLFIIREGKYDFSGEFIPACLLRYDYISSLRQYQLYFVDDDCSRDPMYQEMEEQAIGLSCIRSCTIYEKRTFIILNYFRNMLRNIKSEFIPSFKKEISRFLSKLYVNPNVNLDINELKNILMSYGDIIEINMATKIRNENKGINFIVKKRERPISIENVKYYEECIYICDILKKYKTLMNLLILNPEPNLNDWLEGVNNLWKFTENLSLKQLKSLIFYKQIDETLTPLIKEEFRKLFQSELLKYVNSQLENDNEDEEAPLPNIYKDYIDSEIDFEEFESDDENEYGLIRDNIYETITYTNVTLYPSSLFDTSDSSNAIRIVVR